MKVLHLVTREMGGGAARAAVRLHHALLESGTDSRLLVDIKSSDSPLVSGPRSVLKHRLKSRLTSLPVSFYRHRSERPFSSQLTPLGIGKRIRAIDPDIVHVHWINDGFTNLRFLADSGLPIVITLHDMWWMTGGCHYTGGCQSFQTACGRCPNLSSTRQADLSRLLWHLKSRIYAQSDLHFIAPSSWMERVAVESELLKKFPVHVVPNAIDTARFRPLDRSFSRDALGLPRDLPLVLFGAINSTGDKRKGFAELVSAFRYLENNRSEIGVLIFGSDRPEVDIGVPTFCLGTLSDDYSLALAYSAADVFACPSREDNLPNTVVEALSCGLPIVAFETGGLVDLVDHGTNGYLAAPFDPEDFAVGLEWCVNSRRRHTLSEQARNGAVRRYEQQVVSRVHLDLYRSLLAEPVDMKDASP